MSTAIADIKRDARGRRIYSDREKAEALALLDACGSLTETAQATGIPDSTLSQWSNGVCGVSSPDIPYLRTGINVEALTLSSRFDEIAAHATRLVLERLLDPQRAKKIPIPHLMNAAGIAVDKSQLLRGEPTSISGISDEERQLRVAELFTKLQQRLQLSPPTSAE